MNNGFRMRFVAVPSLITALFVAPAFSEEAEHDHDHGAPTPETVAPDAGTKTPKSVSESKDPNSQAAANQGGMMMDKKSMCDMHRQMMNAKSPAERQGIIDERMQGMPSDARQTHLQMMDEQCK
ncbi:hypothetical protein [Bordetella bronchialis]|nr:hypothetical protein [Bordetella bronchialis]